MLCSTRVKIEFVMNKNYDLEKRFGAKLAYVRKSKKLSQMKLAEIVDMNFNYIGQIERGEANVTIKTMKTLANALDVEVGDLFEFYF
ncbi:MAG: helix-turn-helix domain-containing protein [Fusobacterium sp.]|nr:helix-turn-helix domain-containing protein [Fusobacterium sp.]